MEIQRLRFGTSVHQILVTPAGGFLEQLHILHAAVDLVGGGINKNGIPAREPRRFKRVKRPQRVGLEVITWIRDRGGHCHLPGQVHDHIRIPGGLQDDRRIAHIPGDYLERVLTEALLQPFQVPPGAAAG